MYISLSIAADDRKFSKIVRLVRPDFEIFFAEFSKIELINPIHEAILIGLTDSKPFGYFDVVPNKDGFFQVLAGMSITLDMHAFKKELFEVLEKAVFSCPFSKPDKERFVELLSGWKGRLLE